ncbi:KIR protein [Plasmodium coatneyi]|uniref:KIR protein n=1 Tax=Plasmodium coatneyi TaxID=208452 RepID=A0A1B1DXE9_9APIC|nr:KIR protein [Plasmodium coatneyi]ANQ07438.1 KIR protein [Plasmodium coatneyi]
MDELPSEKVYNTFNSGNTTCSSWPMLSGRSEVIWKDKLNEYPSIRSRMEDMMRAACYVSEEVARGKSENDLCGSLYFWLGDIVHKNLGGRSTFSQVMDEIYQTIRGCITKYNCNIIYKGTSQSEFKKRKDVFDYSKDYETINLKLGEGASNCGEKIYTYLGRVVPSYKALSGYCGRQSEGDQYCKELGDIFIGNKDPEQLKSQCESLKNAARERAENCFKDLPSQKIYNELEQRKGCPTLPGGQKCCSKVESGKNRDLEDTLGIYTYSKNYAKEITGNWYHASEIGGDTLSHEERCKFLYYWTGTKIKEKVGRRATLESAMKEIYEHLARFACNNRCTNFYDDNSSLIIFENGKKLFDYYYDYAALKQSTDCNAILCSSTYEQYLEEAKKAYSTISGICNNGGSSGIYCSEFKSKVTKGDISEPTDLICRSVGQPQIAVLPATLGSTEEVSGTPGPERGKHNKIYFKLNKTTS